MSMTLSTKHASLVAALALLIGIGRAFAESSHKEQQKGPVKCAECHAKIPTEK